MMKPKIIAAGKRHSAKTGSLLVCGFILSSLLLILGTMPSSSDFAVAVFPPWWSGSDALRGAASAGEIVSLRQMSTVFVVHANSPGLSSRLHEAGAIFVLNSAALIACAGLKPKTTGSGQ